jgi:hypothetical protein
VWTWLGGEAKTGFIGRLNNGDGVAQSIKLDGQVTPGFNAQETQRICNATILYAAAQRDLRSTLGFTGNLDMTGSGFWKLLDIS